jgi:hypothetical protein
MASYIARREYLATLSGREELRANGRKVEAEAAFRAATRADS